MRKRLVLTRSDQGDGGWSLHPPGTTEEQISGGEVPPTMTGMAEKIEEGDDWDAPSASDYAIAETYHAAGLRGGEFVMSEEDGSDTGCVLSPEDAAVASVPLAVPFDGIPRVLVAWQSGTRVWCPSDLLEVTKPEPRRKV
jgi:hypothetical protein